MYGALCYPPVTSTPHVMKYRFESDVTPAHLRWEWISFSRQQTRLVRGSTDASDSITPVYECLMDYILRILGIPRRVTLRALLNPENKNVCSNFLQAKDPPSAALIVGIQSLNDRHSVGLRPSFSSPQRCYYSKALDPSMVASFQIKFSNAATFPQKVEGILFLDIGLKEGPITAQNFKSVPTLRLIFINSRHHFIYISIRFQRVLIMRRLYPVPNMYNWLSQMIKAFFVPAMQAQEANLGKMTHQAKQSFIFAVNEYLEALETNDACAKEKFKLAPCRDIDIEVLQDSHRVQEAARNLKDLGLLEECVCHWMRQVSLEVQEIDMIREEVSNSGPRTEMRFWRQRATRYNLIMKEMNAPLVKKTLTVLTVASSNTLSTWKELDDRVVAIHCEALKNAKFLQVIIQRCNPLYRYEINEMKKEVGNLMHCLQCLYSYSPHYRSFAHMSILFVKITNQMIISCRGYIVDSSRGPMWSQDLDQLTERLKDCIELKKAYQNAYYKVQKNTRDDQKVMKFSEAQIFGDFNAFVARVEAILHIIESIKKFAVLRNVPFDGRGKLVEHFEKIYDFITSRSYDFLDLENTQFVEDFEQFGSEMKILQENLQAAYNAQCNHSPTVLLNLRQASKLKRAQLPILEQESRYRRLITQLRSEFDEISDIYTRDADSPPIQRNFPPYSGRIAWARNYYLRMAEPMLLLYSQSPSVCNSREGQRTIRQFNRISEALVAYEITVFQAWKKSASLRFHSILGQLSGLHASILTVQKTSTQVTYMANFDENIRMLLREITCLDHLGCPIPTLGEELHRRALFLKKRLDKVQNMLRYKNRVEQMIPPNLEKLFVVRIHRINEALAPGLYIHDWYSSLFDKWIANCESVIRGLERTVKGAQDILDYRIEPTLAAMGRCKFVRFPDQPGTHPYELPSGRGNPTVLTIASSTITSAVTSAGVTSSSASSVSARASASVGFHLQSRREPGVGWSLGEFIRTTVEQANNAAALLQQLSQIVFEAAEAYATTALADFDAFVKLFGERYRKEGPEISLSVYAEEASESHFTSPSTIDAKEDDNGTSMQQEAKKIIMQTASAVDEMIRNFGQFAVEAVIKSVRGSLDDLWRIFGSRECLGLLKDVEMGTKTRAGHLKPTATVRCEVVLQGDHLNLRPSLEEIQAGLKNCIKAILSSTKNIGKWSEVGRLSAVHGSSVQTNEQDVNCYTDVRHDKEIYKLQSLLLTWINSTKKVNFLPGGQILELESVISPFQDFLYLWTTSPLERLQEFLNEHSMPTIAELEEVFAKLYEVEKSLINLYDIYYIGPLEIHTNGFKYLALRRLKEHQQVFVDLCVERLIYPVFADMAQIEATDRIISKPPKTIADISTVMEAISSFRDIEIAVEMRIMVAEEAQQILGKYQAPLSMEIVDRIEAVRWIFYRVKDRLGKAMNELLTVESKYREDLRQRAIVMKDEIDDFIEAFNQKGPREPNISQTEAMDRQVIFRNNYERLMMKAEEILRGQRLFGLPEMSLANLRAVGKQMEMLQRLYSLYSDVYSVVNQVRETPWREANFQEIEYELLALQTRCLKLPSVLKSSTLYSDLETTLSTLVGKMPILQMFRNPAVKSRHWAVISQITGQPNIDPEADSMLSAKVIIDLPIGPGDGAKRVAVEDVCMGATREKEIEVKLQRVAQDWEEQEFILTTFKNRGELLFKGSRIAEIQSLLEDSLMTLTSLSNSRQDQIAKWVNNLTTVNEVLDYWVKVQSLWVYLEAVFVGGDIGRQLPKEARRFLTVDKSWVKIIDRARETPSVVVCCTSDTTLLELLPRMLEQLEICQRSLSGYLESKRLLFPRFFFVSDPVLLEILGQASTPEAIQPHLLAIFDSIHHLHFAEESAWISAAYSALNEELTLNPQLRCEGPVEMWLMRLLMTVKYSLLDRIRMAHVRLMDVELNLQQILNEQICQMAILSIQMVWTQDATMALNESRENPKIMTDISQRFTTLLEMLISRTTANLSPRERTKYETLITIHLHQKDVFDDIVQQSIHSPDDFDWLKQTRVYFMDETTMCVVSITNVNFEYQYEFLGCTERLVITPLTDRCYITLAQALNMCYGGAPAGPAGTGKTETDMGRCLGQYVVVFNCSDQMDFRGLGRLFKGLAQSGAWGCFDEFNRIELPVLSVAAQQIAIVLFAKRDQKDDFVFPDGDLITLNAEFGIFITMNPGYAGRQELPENLKMNFRTVAMMVPDRLIIIRVRMASCGFIDNLTLAKKFFNLYNLCEEQLSNQVHYDFGLRNILSVLRTLGAVRRSSPEEGENKIVMRVLRDMNLSKLVDQDEALFLSILRDLFPGVNLGRSRKDPEIGETLEHNAEEMNLIAHRPWVLKVLQLYETQKVRHGLMILGPSGSGKTKCVEVLLRTLSEVDEVRREVRMNPKAITTSQMFGRLDVATNDWTDGIFSTLWRRTTRMKPKEHCWLVLDGPVDAIWIENLNSVLDDNMTLTLANGDRIPMAPRCKILFEVDNVDNASPSTISRNGMVFISSSTINWEPLIKTWINSRLKPQRARLTELATAILPPIIKFVTREVQVNMPFLEAFYVAQFRTIFDAVSTPEASEPMLLEMYFLFALTWSFGALLERSDRAKFDEHLRNTEVFGRLFMPPPTIRGKAVTIFDYRVDHQHGRWDYWGSSVPSYDYPKRGYVEFERVLVPNQDNVITEFLVQNVCKTGRSVLLFGEPGTAKTAIINKYMQSFSEDTDIARNCNFSSATTPFSFQTSMETFVDKRVGFTFGPPLGKKLTIFIDDISMPVVNEWGDQVANEIVRQTMECGGFYSLRKPGEFITIVDVQFTAAMVTPGGGRNDIPMRLKRQFCLFNCSLPSDASIDTIFTTIAVGHFSMDRGFTREVQELAITLVPLTRRIWASVKAKMLPTPRNFHYIFNLRDLSRIWRGITFATSEVFQTREYLILLWRNELTRVLSDKLTSAEDKSWFTDNLHQQTIGFFGEGMNSVLTQKVSFCDFMRAIIDNKKYFVFKVFEIEALRQRLMQYLETMNSENHGAPLKVVFFNQIIGHIVRACRALRSDRGNLLMIGVGGSGKATTIKLATYVCGYRLFTINTRRHFSCDSLNGLFMLRNAEVRAYAYTMTNLLEDIKLIYRRAGMEGKGIVFQFNDTNVKDEIFLDHINNILMGGMVETYFNREELEEAGNSIITIYRRENPHQSCEGHQLTDFFLSRARRHMHIALLFSPIGERLRARALAFPGLVAGCTIDWFHAWPRDALVACAERVLQEPSALAPTLTNPSVCAACVDVVADIHLYIDRLCTSYARITRRINRVTPKTFFHFLHACKTIYSRKFAELTEIAHRMDTGVRRLQEARESITFLKTELAVAEEDLKEANYLAEQVLQRVLQETETAADAKSRVEVLKQRCEGIVQSMEIDREEAQEKLVAAQPALKEAEEALNTIKVGDIATVRKLQKPPNLIMRIMDCVNILFYRPMVPIQVDPEKPQFFTPSWAESIRFLSNQNFLTLLINYPMHILTEEMIDLIEPYTNAPDYNPQSARKTCGNVAGLLQWTLAMVKYFFVSKVVVPLQDSLKKSEQLLERAQGQLIEVEAELEEKAVVLNKVQAEYEVAMRRKQKLKDEADLCIRRMDTANQLIDGLSGEATRWSETSRYHKQEIVLLTGNAIALAVFLTYMGGFNQAVRLSALKYCVRLLKKYGVPQSERLDCVKALASPTTVSRIGLKQITFLNFLLIFRQPDTREELHCVFTDRKGLWPVCALLVVNEWNVQGLPLDELSIQNAVIATARLRYPLLIDPQGQGKKWLTNLYAGRVIVTSVSSKKFKTDVEEALNTGKNLIVEGIMEAIDSGLDRLITQSFYTVGTTLQVKIWDFETTVDPKFQLFLTTQLANPVFTPELLANTALIDFSVTVKGLEDQLLAHVVSVEREKLESLRIELLNSTMENKKRIESLQINLLYRLANTKGSLVDDQDLLEVLKSTKITSEGVMEQLAKSKEAEAEIEAAREEYRPVAERGALIFFLLEDMAKVNRMYETGLPQFLVLFNESLMNSEESSVTQKRIHKIVKYMTKCMWRFYTRGYYKKDFVMFTLSLAMRIELQMKNIYKDEVEVFLRGGSALSLLTCPPKPAKWIADDVWLNINALSRLPAFTSLVDQVIGSERRWRRWHEVEAPEESVFPLNYDTDLSTFGRLLFIRTWCPDRVVHQARKYISETLGHRFAEETLLNVEEIYADSTPKTPIINLLTVGADPTLLIEQLARRMQTELHFISMGQGQEIHARQYIAQAMRQGSWVLLQNCHLCLDYINELSTLLAGVRVESEAYHRVPTDPHSRTDSPDESLMDQHTALPNISHTNSKRLVTSDQFRLWITTEEHSRFPINFLQMSVKFINQPPEGLRSGLIKTFSDISQDLLDSCVSMHWKVVLYALAFLHRTLEGRRKFTPMGWSVPYEFNLADYSASVEFMRSHIDEIEVMKRNVRSSGIDWKCVRYLLSEIQFGGRITDPEDTVIMVTLTKQMFKERMFQPEYELAPGYIIPHLSTVNQYLGYIHSLPSQESPESIHLHPNAEIAYSTQFTESMIASIQAITDLEVIQDIEGAADIYEASDTTTGLTKEIQVREICESMLSTIPPPYNPFTLPERLKTLGSLKPVVIFLRQEIDRISKLLKVTKRVLSNLVDAIDGKVVLNENLRDAMDSIYLSKVPAIWLRISWEASTLGFWFTELKERNDQLHSWLSAGAPHSFWFPGFFNPMGLLTALRQEVSRAHAGWSLEFIRLEITVTKRLYEDVTEAPREGLYIHGLFLQAASWDRRSSRIIEPRPKQLFDPVPVIHVTTRYELTPEEMRFQQQKVIDENAVLLVQQNNSSIVHRPGSRLAQQEASNTSIEKLDIPVYKKARRTTKNFITRFTIPCSKTADHWKMRGVALLCDVH
ncbi:Dynein heavy chain 5, axonemal [Echinococcus granulosus]|uniref:Dynein heavy chain 5, axonemal n=1 Tax=Echinococcus granulosus TaxID=6210 RepID=W6UKT9_ECHGR|nr:Dynein heavy chain 5, axonemal [Echinococcus granulosus]EUB61781.1 Dynein heavy chain 5, axonemal [Echinococcus granulosus]